MGWLRRVGPGGASPSSTPAPVPVSSNDTRPSVLMVADQRGWAFERIALQVQRHLAGEYAVHVVYAADLKSPEEFAPVYARIAPEIVVFMWYLTGGRFAPVIDRRRTRIVSTFFSLCGPEDFGGEPLDTDVALAANRRFAEVVRGAFPGVPVGLCEDGVDCTVFQPSYIPRGIGGPLRALWTGNSSHGDMVGEPDLKGYNTVLAPAVAGLDGVELDVRDRRNGYWEHETMPDWFRTGDVILCASSREGTPNPILEGAACGLLPVTTDVGLIPDFLKHGESALILRRTPDAFRQALTWCRDHRAEVCRMGQAARQAVLAFDWQRKAEQYRAVFRWLRDRRTVVPGLQLPAPPADGRQILGTGRDLSDELTVFLVTTSRTTAPDVRAALGRQDVRFRFAEIRDVAPMDRAFQAMLDRAETSYFVQVDDDMVLRPGAIRALYEDLRSQPPEVYQLALPLLDVDLDKVIIGVKSYRTELARRIPYVTSGSCEVDQIARARKLGLRVVIRYECDEAKDRAAIVGDHVVPADPRERFERYRRLVAKAHKFGYYWPVDLQQKFAARLGIDPNNPDLWSLLGAAIGACVPLPDGEADFRHPDPAFVALRLANPPPPRELTIYQTATCNLRCSWCSRQHGLVEPGTDCSAATVDAVCTHWPTLRTACIAGFGEPLTSPGLWDVVAALERRGMAFSIITNGTLLSRNVAELARHHWLAVSVSLNAPDRQRYERTTGVDAFDAVLRGIRDARQAGLPVRASAVVSRLNLDDVPDLVRLAAGLEVPLDLHNLLPHGVDRVGDPAWHRHWSQVLRSDDPVLVRHLQGLRDLPGAAVVARWPSLVGPPASCPRRCESPWFSVGVDALHQVTACRRVKAPTQFGARFTNEGGADGWVAAAPLRELRAAMLTGEGLPAVCRACFGNWTG